MYVPANVYIGQQMAMLHLSATTQVYWRGRPGAEGQAYWRARRTLSMQNARKKAMAEAYATAYNDKEATAYIDKTKKELMELLAYYQGQIKAYKDVEYRLGPAKPESEQQGPGSINR